MRPGTHWRCCGGPGGSESEMNDPVVMIYPLESKNGDASVVGNREGQTTYLGVSAEDGEDYDLGVTLQLGGPHADGVWREPYFVARNKYRELGG